MTRLFVLTLPLLLTLDAAAQVRPKRPTEDSHVRIRIPHDGGGGCRVSARVVKKPGRGRTILHASARPSGPCEKLIRAGFIWHPLGKLKAGRYVVQAHNSRYSFMILPKTVRPDPPKGPALLHVRRAIIDKYNPAICVGPPGAIDEKRIATTKRRHKSLWRAAKRFWPRASTEELYRRVLQLKDVRLTWLKRARYGYSFTEGCPPKRTRFEGAVTIAPTVTVGPRKQAQP